MHHVSTGNRVKYSSKILYYLLMHNNEVRKNNILYVYDEEFNIILFRRKNFSQK